MLRDAPLDRDCEDCGKPILVSGHPDFGLYGTCGCREKDGRVRLRHFIPRRVVSITALRDLAGGTLTPFDDLYKEEPC